MVGNKMASGIVVLLCLVLGTVTWSRNAMWLDPVALWRDSAIHAPNKARPWSELGKYLLQEGDNVGALKIFLQVTEKSQGIGETGKMPPRLDETSMVNLVVALAKGGEFELALFVTNKVLEQKITTKNLSKMLTNKGNVLYKLKRIREAEGAYREAFSVNGENYMAMNNLGYVLLMHDRLDEAAAVLAMVPAACPYTEKRDKILVKVQERRKALR